MRIVCWWCLAFAGDTNYVSSSALPFSRAAWSFALWVRSDVPFKFSQILRVDAPGEQDTTTPLVHTHEHHMLPHAVLHIAYMTMIVCCVRVYTAGDCVVRRHQLQTARHHHTITQHMRRVTPTTTITTITTCACAHTSTSCSLATPSSPHIAAHVELTCARHVERCYAGNGCTMR